MHVYYQPWRWLLWLASSYCTMMCSDNTEISPELVRRNLLYGEWDYEEFCRLHLNEYKEMCKDFGADFTSKDM